MRSNTAIYIKLILSAFFWGGSAIAGKLLMGEMNPYMVTFMRFFWATLILFFICMAYTKNIKISLSFSEHISLFLMGVIGISLCYIFYFQGLNMSSAFNASLIEAIIPLCTVLISVVCKKEKFTVKTLIGSLLAYLGISIIITKMDMHIISTLSFNKGDLLLLLSTLCFGTYNVLYRHFASNIPSIIQTYYIFLYGTIGIVPWVIYSFYFYNDGITFINHFSIENIGHILFLSLGSSVLAYLFFNQGIQILGASKASIFINYVPIITIFLSLIILKEIPTISQIIGCIVVLGGIYLSQSKTLTKNKNVEDIEVQ